MRAVGPDLVVAREAMIPRRRVLVDGAATWLGLGVLAWYSVVYFGLQLHSPTGFLFDTRVLSMIQFTRDQFDSFVRTGLSVGMALGAAVLAWTVVSTLFLRANRTKLRVAAWFINTVAVVLLFLASLVPLLAVDREHPVTQWPSFAVAYQT